MPSVGDICFLVSGSYALGSVRKKTMEKLDSSIWVVKIDSELPRNKFLYRLFLQIFSTYPEGEADDEQEYIETDVQFADSRDCANKFPSRNSITKSIDDSKHVILSLNITHEELLGLKHAQPTVGPPMTNVRCWRSERQMGDGDEDSDEDSEDDSRADDDEEDDDDKSSTMGMSNEGATIDSSTGSPDDDGNTYTRVGAQYQSVIPDYEPDAPLPSLEDHIKVVGCPEICSVLPAGEIIVGPKWTFPEIRVFEKSLYSHAANFGLIAKDVNDPHFQSPKKPGRKPKMHTVDEQKTPSSLNPAAVNNPYFDEVNKRLGVQGMSEYTVSNDNKRTVGMCIQYFFDQFHMTRAYEVWHKFDEKRYLAIEREQREAERLETKEARRQRRVATERAKEVRNKKDEIPVKRQHHHKKSKKPKNEQSTIHKRSSIMYKPLPRDEKPWCIASLEFMPARSGDIPDECLAETELNYMKREGAADDLTAIQLEAKQSLPKEVPESYCVCKGPDVGFMVLCNECESWFHTACVGLRKDMLADGSIFTCMDCAKPRPELDNQKAPELFYPASWKIKHQRGEAPNISIIAKGEVIVEGSLIEPRDGFGLDGFPNGEPVNEDTERKLRESKDSSDSEDEDDDDDDEDGPRKRSGDSKYLSLEDGTFATLDSVPMGRNYTLLLAFRKVPIWNKNEKGLYSGFAAPSVVELPTMLKTRPEIIPWHGAIRRNCAFASYAQRKEDRKRKKHDQRVAKRENQELSRQERKRRKLSNRDVRTDDGFRPSRPDDAIRRLVKQRIHRYILGMSEESFRFPLNEILAEQKASEAAANKLAQKALTAARQEEKRRATAEAQSSRKEEKRRIRLEQAQQHQQRKLDQDTKKGKGKVDVKKKKLKMPSAPIFVETDPSAQFKQQQQQLMRAQLEQQMKDQAYQQYVLAAHQPKIQHPSNETSMYLQQALLNQDIPDEQKNRIMQQFHQQQQHHAQIWDQFLAMSYPNESPMKVYLTLQEMGLMTLRKQYEEENSKLDEEIKKVKGAWHAEMNQTERNRQDNELEIMRLQLKLQQLTVLDEKQAYSRSNLQQFMDQYLVPSHAATVDQDMERMEGIQLIKECIEKSSKHESEGRREIQSLTDNLHSRIAKRSSYDSIESNMPKEKQTSNWRAGQQPADYEKEQQMLEQMLQQQQYLQMIAMQQQMQLHQQPPHLMSAQQQQLLEQQFRAQQQQWGQPSPKMDVMYQGTMNAGLLNQENHAAQKQHQQHLQYLAELHRKKEFEMRSAASSSSSSGNQESNARSHAAAAMAQKQQHELQFLLQQKQEYERRLQEMKHLMEQQRGGSHNTK